ncbi:MAG: CBS domain-containing protein [Candidatus Kariarchaeaceae archaeon]
MFDIATKYDIIEGAPNRTLESAILIMGVKKFRRLPITKLGKIKGILTVTDIIRAIAKTQLPHAYKEKITEWMTENPKTIHLNASVIEAAQLMSEGNFGSLLLVDQDDDILKGIVTERDFLRHYRSDSWVNMTLADIEPRLLSQGVVKIRSNLSMDGVIQRMNQNKTHRVLIVDESDKLMGILTANDITSLCSKEKEEINENPNFLKSLTAQYLTTPNVTTTNLEMPLSEAVEIMCAKGIGGLPILKSGEIIGMLTERTIVHIIANLKSV